MFLLLSSAVWDEFKIIESVKFEYRIINSKKKLEKWGEELAKKVYIVLALICGGGGGVLIIILISD